MTTQDLESIASAAVQGLIKPDAAQWSAFNPFTTG